MKAERELLYECKLQLQYLNEKFGETGTTNAIIAKIDNLLRFDNGKTFKAFENGVEKLESTAHTMEEAIQFAFDEFGDVVTTWEFTWL